MNLKYVPTIDLLGELLRREQPSQGPRKIVFAEPVLESIIGIGNDNVARIFVHKDDLAALHLLIMDPK